VIRMGGGFYDIDRKVMSDMLDELKSINKNLKELNETTLVGFILTYTATHYGGTEESLKRLNRVKQEVMDVYSKMIEGEEP